MLCPKCKVEMKNGYCLRCGYMKSGNNIQIEKKEDKRYEDIKLFNEDFDTIYRNENAFVPFILGNFYLSYRGNIILGTLWGFLDYYLFYWIVNIASSLYFNFITYFAIFFYLIVTRILYGTLMNSLCLQIDYLKIKMIKKLYKEEYKKILAKHKKSVVYIFLTILVYIIIIIILVTLRKIENGTILL